MIEFTNSKEAKENFVTVSQDSEATAEQKTEALQGYMNAVQKETEKNIMDKAQTLSSDNNVLQSRGQNVLTSEEHKFFNAVVEEGGFKETETLPTTTQERVFEDLVEQHPFIKVLGLQNLGAVTEFIYSDPSGSAIWGSLFGDIKGQLNASFRKESIAHLKLTAFIPLANDMLKLGPAWIERYVRTMITEAMAVGLERGFIAGKGPANDEPTGLLKDVDSSSGTVSDKASSGTLTFEPGKVMVQELKGVVEKLSTHDVNGTPKIRNVAGKVIMVVNPFDSFGIQANATIQNANGVYTTSYPFNPKQVESEFVPQGKVLFFIDSEYIAAMGGTEPIKKFDQTMALEDATLYIAKQFATGKPVDNDAAAVYDLNLNDTTTTTTTAV